jgi:hypothetical protein
MPTIERARVIQSHMGGSIYFDPFYSCYRVLKCGSSSLNKYYDEYVLVER